MTTKHLYTALLVTISLTSIAAPSYPAPSATAAGGAADVAPMNASQLRALVAPIALYPDPLVAQVLSAATFPDQVAVANYWVQQHKELTGQSLMHAVDSQAWNASIKALTEFPSVLDNMAKNLNWTSALGEAYHNQSSEVMAAIQTLRAQAKTQGSLKSGPQMTVTQSSPGTIEIEPTNPDVVYVPDYNPSVVYGTPYVTPGYTPGEVAAGTLLGFGTGVAVGALAGGGCCGWGWGAWNCNWAGGAVAYNHGAFYGNSAWHGRYYNGAYHHGYGYRNAYDRAAANRGYAARADESKRGLEGMHGNPWAHADHAFRNANAFSGFDDRFGRGGGWHSRAASFRGWGSMHRGGFFGGRFGGGRLGGGHFGGFRRRR